MEYLYKHIAAAATTTVAGSGQGVLHLITVNSTDNAITVTDATGTLAVLKNGIAEGTYEFNIQWAGFLKVTTVGDADITVAYGINQSA